MTTQMARITFLILAVSIFGGGCVVKDAGALNRSTAARSAAETWVVTIREDKNVKPADVVTAKQKYTTAEEDINYWLKTTKSNVGATEELNVPNGDFDKLQKEVDDFVTFAKSMPGITPPQNSGGEVVVWIVGQGIQIFEDQKKKEVTRVQDLIDQAGWKSFDSKEIPSDTKPSQSPSTQTHSP